MRHERRLNLAMIAALVVACGCGGDPEKDGDTAGDADTDVDTDVDTDTDAGTDPDTDAALGTDADQDGHTVEDGDCIDDDPRFTGVSDRFVEVGVGQTTGCALDSAGAIHCWGDDYGAVLGSGV